MKLTEDITTVFSKQLSLMCRVVNFLNEHREHNQHDVDLNMEMLEYLDDVCFYVVKDDELYTAQVFLDGYIYASMGCKCKHVDDDTLTELEIAGKCDDSSLIALNTDTIVYVYSRVLVSYYNSICIDNEPMFGKCNRQIPFAPHGATMNKQWWERFKYQYITSLNSFANLMASPCSLILGHIRCVTTCIFIHDGIGVRTQFTKADTPQRFIEP